MAFQQKKKKPWNKGLKTGSQTTEHKQRRADALKGKKKSKTHCDNISKARKGTTLSSETRIKIAKAKKGSIPWNKGIKNHLQSGPKNGNWKGGITPNNKLIRDSFEMKVWRQQILIRDDYTCQVCFERGGRLEVDHIKPFAQFPELRFDLGNGRVLCRVCHKRTPTWGNRRLCIS